MRGWLTARPQMLLGAGILLCLAAAPVTALASGPRSSAVPEGPDPIEVTSCSTHALSAVAYTASGATFPSLTAHVHAGDTVTASFTVLKGCSQQLSLVSYTAPSGVFDGTTLLQQRVFDVATGTLTAGRHALTVHVPGCFFQVDFARGAVISGFGPPGTSNYYGGRLISSGQGGATSCTPAPKATVDVHIFGQGTTSEVSGGSVSVALATGTVAAPNPVQGLPVTAGRTVGVSATAPPGWTFISNPAQPDVISNNGASARLASGIAVPAGQTGQVLFYVARAAPGPAHLTLLKEVDITHTTVGGTVRYTITLANTGGQPATNVMVEDLLTGSAGYLVNDGTETTGNSFVGVPLTTVFKFGTGHYRWSYPTVNPGDANVVSFTAQLRLPPAPLVNVTVLTLVNTVTATGIAPAIVTTTAPYLGGAQSGGVQGVRTGVPATGLTGDVVMGGYLLLAGLGLVLLGVLARRPEEPDR